MKQEATTAHRDTFVVCQYADVSRSPTTPVPYQIYAYLDSGQNTATKTRIRGEPAFKFDSFAPVIGHAPGVGGGINSNAYHGYARPLGMVSSVLVENTPMCRCEDILFCMNAILPLPGCPGNTLGKAAFFPDNLPNGPMCPTAAEKSWWARLKREALRLADRANRGLEELNVDEKIEDYLKFVLNSLEFAKATRSFALNRGYRKPWDYFSNLSDFFEDLSENIGKYEKEFGALSGVFGAIGAAGGRKWDRSSIRHLLESISKILGGVIGLDKLVSKEDEPPQCPPKGASHGSDRGKSAAIHPDATAMANRIWAPANLSANSILRSHGFQSTNETLAETDAEAEFLRQAQQTESHSPTADALIDTAAGEPQICQDLHTRLLLEFVRLSDHLLTRESLDASVPPAVPPVDSDDPRPDAVDRLASELLSGLSEELKTRVSPADTVHGKMLRFEQPHSPPEADGHGARKDGSGPAAEELLLIEPETAGSLRVSGRATENGIQYSFAGLIAGTDSQAQADSLDGSDPPVNMIVYCPTTFLHPSSGKPGNVPGLQQSQHDTEKLMARHWSPMLSRAMGGGAESTVAVVTIGSPKSRSDGSPKRRSDARVLTNTYRIYGDVAKIYQGLSSVAKIHKSLVTIIERFRDLPELWEPLTKVFDFLKNYELPATPFELIRDILKRIFTGEWPMKEKEKDKKPACEVPAPLSPQLGFKVSDTEGKLCKGSSSQAEVKKSKSEQGDSPSR